ncbi:WD40 repeat domain-containing protein, partial [Nostoc sp.]|uniref:WD40 repeat domain-containing protein n=1 Tax=Nostoc sp. TaxID=1180 RepID=UPI002FF97442
MGGIATRFALQTDEVKNLFLDKSAEKKLKVGRSKKYYQILTDFDFISLKIQYPQFGVEALIRDYALIYEPEVLENLEQDEKLDPEQIKILKLIQDALQLSAHVLNQDQTQLVGQLWGRLQSFPQPEIQQILADAVESKTEIPRFRPITASLTTPGGNLLRTLTGHKRSVTAVAIAPDGKTAVSASSDNTLKLWDLETGKEISTLSGHKDSVRAVALAPDGKTAVSASDDKTLKLWDLATGKEISTLSGHKDSVRAVALAPDGKTAVSASSDNTLKLWDLEAGKKISTLSGHKDSVRAVVLAPDGKTAVSASSDNT